MSEEYPLYSVEKRYSIFNSNYKEKIMKYYEIHEIRKNLGIAEEKLKYGTYSDGSGEIPFLKYLYIYDKELLEYIVIRHRNLLFNINYENFELSGEINTIYDTEPINEEIESIAFLLQFGLLKNKKTKNDFLTNDLYFNEYTYNEIIELFLENYNSEIDVEYFITMLELFNPNFIKYITDPDNEFDDVSVTVLETLYNDYVKNIRDERYKNRSKLLHHRKTIRGGKRKKNKKNKKTRKRKPKNKKTRKRKINKRKSKKRKYK